MTSPLGSDDGVVARRSELKAGAALTYLSMALGLVIALIYTPVMLRLLGQNEYGLFTLVVSLVAYLSLFSFGFQSAYMRLHARYREAKDAEGLAQLNSLFLILLSVLGIGSLVAGWALVAHADVILGGALGESELGTSRTLFAILAVGVAISMPLSVFEFHVIANERFVFQKSLVVARTILGPLVILPLLFAGYGSVGMAAATVALGVLAQLLTAAFCLKSLGMRFATTGMRLKVFKETMAFSSFVFVGILVDQINWSIDKYIVGFYWGTTSVAIYGIATIFALYFMTMSSAISSVFTPRVHQMVAGNVGDRALTSLFARVGRLQFAVLFGVVIQFVFFGEPFIVLWAGESYREAYPVLLLLTIPALIPLVQNLGIEIQRAKNLHKFRSVAYLAIALVNVSVSIVLVREVGPIGAAVGTAASLILGNGLVMNWYYETRVGLDVRSFWSQILRLVPSTLPAMVVGLVLALTQDLGRPALLLAGMVLVGAIYGASVWRFGLNSGERALVKIPSSWRRRPASGLPRE